VEDDAGQQGAIGLPSAIDAARTAAIRTAAQARAAVQAQARESRHADAHSRAAEVLAGVFRQDGDIDGALRAMTARACVTLVADRCSFLHRLAGSGSLLYESDAAPAGPVARPALGWGHSDPSGSIPRPFITTTVSQLECPATCNPVTLLRARGLPTSAHAFLRRTGVTELLGVLSTYRADGRPFTPQDMLLLDAIADRVTLALIRNESSLPKERSDGDRPARPDNRRLQRA